MSEQCYWKFPFQYRIIELGMWYVRVEKWLLGLKRMSWDIRRKMPNHPMCRCQLEMGGES